MPSGTIKLMSGGMKVKEAQYYCVKARREIIESWIRIYGVKMDIYHVHVCPIQDRKNLTNKNYKL